MSERISEAIIPALLALAKHNIPPDVQELLMQGDPMRGIPPNALTAALSAALSQEPGVAEGMVLVRDGDPIAFDDCPEGLFLFGATLAVMTEYSTTAGGIHQRDAYIIESGEYFWGGTSLATDRAKLLVQPVTAAPASAQPEGWRSMDSAPKDGTRFFAYTDHDGVDFFHWQHLEYADAPVGWRDGFIQVYREDDPDGPRGWMPIPLPAAPGGTHG